MEYNEEDYLKLSGLQHYAFCPRQWALIHIEGQWFANVRTVEGDLLHRNAHDEDFRETRGSLRIMRSLSIHSAVLGIAGQCDVVEFHADENGIAMEGWPGKWRLFPVEYKRGEPKKKNEDRLQLCAQAMCLEEMLCCHIPVGALYYNEIRRRENVELTEELRQEVREDVAQMHTLFERGYTPKAKRTRACNACSMVNVCLPELGKKSSVGKYIKDYLEKDP